MRWKDSLPRERPRLPFEKIVADIRALYPECLRVFIGGSYARNEMHTHSDVDIILEFPAGSYPRDDRPLWLKWNAWRKSATYPRKHRRGLTIDFIQHRLGGSHVGQHQYRRELGLPTPEITLWKKEKPHA